MKRFSDQFSAYMAARYELADFVVGEWLATLSLHDFDALSGLVERVMYAEASRVSENEINDIMQLAMSAHRHEMLIDTPLDLDEAKQVAVDFELAIWLEFARREHIFAVPDGISLAGMSKAQVLVTSHGVSHAVPRQWAELSEGLHH